MGKRRTSARPKPPQRRAGGLRQWARKNRAEFVTAVVLVVLAAGGVGGYFVHQSVSTAQQKADFEQYRQNHSYRYDVGDEVVLDSAEDERGMAYGYDAGFDWKGTVNATVTGVEEYPSLAAAGVTKGLRLDGQPLDYDDSIDHQGAAMRYVECDLRLRNVDAEAEFPMPGLQDADHAFNCGMFSLISTDPDDTWFLEGAVWFDGQIPDAPPNDGLFYILKPGEERTLKMIYTVPVSVPVDHLALRLGVGENKYLVLFGGR